MTSSTTATLTDAVEAALRGARMVVLCPAHDDSTPSLAVAPGQVQPVLLTCHAGCSTEDVIAASGLDWGSICKEKEFDDSEANEWTPVGDASHRYPYYLADGTLSYEVLRVPMGTGKRFMQRRPDITKPAGWAWNLEGAERTIYRLPQVIEAVSLGRTIHVAEGEKCVHALLRVIPPGDEATCNSGGAGKWLPEFCEPLRGANVIIYADSDDPGTAHARTVREMLLKVQATVSIKEAPAGVLPSGKPVNDVADHLEAGFTLETLLETTPESIVEKARTGIDINALVLRPKGQTKYVIENTLAEGERVIIVGGEGMGKSTLCRQIAVQVAAGIHPFTGARMPAKRVLFIDAENHPDQTLDSWVQLVGLSARHAEGVANGMLTVLEEYESNRNLGSEGGSAWLNERINAYRPQLVVMGPLTNLSEKDLREDEAVRALRNTVNEARSICNSAFIMEHHAPHRQGLDKVRDIRPYGSSLFLKWPDYGFGMQPTEDPKVFEWKRNRGARVRSRYWPDALREGVPNSMEFPWEEAHDL